MKKLNLCLLASTMLVSAAHAKSPDMAFIPPGLGEKPCQESINAVIVPFFQTGTRGDALPIYNANSGFEIAVLRVPDNKLYDEPAPNRTIRKNEAQRKALGEFCKIEENNEPSTLFYAALRFAGNNRIDGADTDILIIGPPKAIDERAPRTAMRGGLSPSDAHHFAARSESPFGAKGEEKLLENTRVHFALGENDWYVSPTHRSEVERFILHSVSQRGGKVGSIEADIKTVMQRIERGAVYRLPTRALSLTNTKLEMIDYAAPPSRSGDLFERPLSDEPLPSADIATARDVSVGAAWEGEWDVDLWVVPSPGAPPLYWNNEQTNDGRFLKDYVSANALHGFETVELDRPVDLDKMFVALNLYVGDAPSGANGKIRIAIGEKTFEAPFEIETRRGNRGDGGDKLVRTGIAPNNHWVVIDLISLIGAVE